MGRPRSTMHLPTLVTVFGATGDLASRKIFPALWHLFERQCCPPNMVVVGVARRGLSQEAFRVIVAEAIRAHDYSIDEEMLAPFLSSFFYQSGDFEKNETYTALKNTIDAHEARWGVCGNKLMYMAVSPTLYTSVFEGLASVGLNLPCGGAGGWTRLLIEKPFGENAEQATALNALLAQHFHEEQLYRIDHYFFKEIVRGIENFRFSNNLFEHKWGNTLIDDITIRLNETLDVAQRGTFYDAVGALRDVGQNHLLAMLSLIAAEYAPHADAARVRGARATILKTLAPWQRAALKEHTFRAQYNGYRSVRGVAPDSAVETYFALETELLHPRWRGVPIRLEAGKALGETRKEIVLTLKHPSPCLLCDVGPHAPNRIVFRIEPRDEIVIHFWTKKPGFEDALEERTFSFFLYEKKNKMQYVEEYATALYKAMHGDQSLFVSTDEVQAAWAFVDPIVHAWRTQDVPLTQYEPGTTPTPAFLERSDSVEGAPRRGTLGIVGLGKMGANIARRLHKKGWHVVGFNEMPDAATVLARAGIIMDAPSLSALVQALPSPRTLWLMVPHAAVDAVLDELTPLLGVGDTIIDGGNSFFKDSIRRAEALKEKQIRFIDVGVSGGPRGALDGSCLMVGGDRETFEAQERLFQDVAAPDSYQFFAGPGMGHFVKMVHNGIEYGMMQSLAEGFAIMRAYSPTLDLERVADVYAHGSVIESRLVGWLRDAFAQQGRDLSAVSGSVAHTGEGEWTVKTAAELKVSAPAITDAFEFRVASTETPSYIGKILSALRNQFGGHAISAHKKP